jgi:hypothetical protein
MIEFFRLLKHNFEKQNQMSSGHLFGITVCGLIKYDLWLNSFGQNGQRLEELKRLVTEQANDSKKFNTLLDTTS